MPRRSRFPGLSRKPSGSFVVRKRVPPALRAAAKALQGVEHEWIEPLGTDKAAEAERGYPAALARIIAKLDAATRLAAGGTPADRAEAAATGVGGAAGRGDAAPHPDASRAAAPLEPAIALRAIEAWEEAETRRSASAILAGRVPHPHDGPAATGAWLEAGHVRSEEICRLGTLDFVWEPPPRERLREFDRALVEALAPHGAKLDVGHPALRVLRAPFRDARLRVLRAESRMHLDWGQGHMPALAHREAKGASRPFSELVDLYRQRRNPKEEDVAPCERRFIEAIGGDKPCGSVSKDDVIRFRDLLERSPARLSREDERLPLPGLASKHEAGVHRWLKDAARRRAEAEQWDDGDDDDGDEADKSGALMVRPLADQTIAKYLLIAKSIFERGVEENWLSSNPTDGVAHPQRGVKLERVPYSDNDMRTLFGGPVHTGMASPWQRMVPGDVVVGNADYWLQLFGPLSGARLEEVGQALVTDIKASDGIAFLAVSTADERGRVVKRLKSGHAARELPLHPRILELGFLDYVAAVRAAGHIRLFPDLLVNRRKDGSPMFTRDFSSKRYARYRAKLGIDDPRKPYHSFRHWVKAMMKRLGVEYSKQDAVLGHAPPSNAGSGYARGETLSLRTKLEIISALSFPGLSEVRRPTAWGLPEPGARTGRAGRGRAERQEHGSGAPR